MLIAGQVLSNLRPWRLRCVHSPSWRQVTADCGCGPILPETPAEAPTGWSPCRCYCDDWWPWRRWPHWGLGCNALRERDRTLVSPVVSYNCNTYVGQSDSSVGLVLCWETPLSLQSTCSLTQTGEDRANKHSDPSAAICVTEPRPFTVFTDSQQQNSYQIWSANKCYPS